MNEGKLTTLSGPSAVEAAGLPRLSDLSDVEAGLVVLTEISHQLPGITWAQMLSTASPGAVDGLAGWWTDLKKATTSVVQGVGDIASNTIRFVGDMGGDLVRLATDAEIVNTVSRAVAAYATGGGSEGLQAVLGNLSQMTAAQQTAAANTLGISREELLAIAAAGAEAKKPDWVKWAVGAGLFTAIMGGAFWLMDRGKSRKK